MFVRVFLFVFGFILSVIGFVYDISYLNLLTFGYNFSFYVKFIFSRVECLLFRDFSQSAMCGSVVKSLNTQHSTLNALANR